RALDRGQGVEAPEEGALALREEDRRIVVRSLRGHYDEEALLGGRLPLLGDGEALDVAVCARLAGERDGAEVAARPARRADGRPELHEGLVQVAGALALDEGLRLGPEPRLHRRRAEGELDAVEAGEDAGDV